MPPNRYLYPGAFSRHIATILAFPSKVSLPTQLREPACGEIASLAAAISEFEPVRLYAQPADVVEALSMVHQTIRDSRGSIENISIIPLATHHLWVRDTGPVYVRGTERTKRKSRFAIDFNFAEWGHKNEVYVDDGMKWPILDRTQLQENSDFAKHVTESDQSPSPVTRIASKLCIEGGALVVDGEGTLLATESSILNANRNASLSREEVETELRHKLGVEKIVWFPGKDGLDITDVHVDAEVNFIRPGVVVLSRPHATASREWWKVHDQIRDILQQSADAKGRRFEVHVVEEPDPGCLDLSIGDEAPATNYVNFYFVNGGVILPRFGDKVADEKALELFERLCPERVVRSVHVRALPLMGGVIHCATQQVIDIDVE